jgi:lipoyl(octanoyl) transferase
MTNEQNHPTSRFRNNKRLQGNFGISEELFKGIVDLKFEIAEKILNYQLELFSFVEHPHVYTFGKSGDLSNLLLSENNGNQRTTFYKINRGGDITYHGPGQIVGYPI